MNISVVIIGTGPMAQAYSKVLSANQISHMLVGRTEKHIPVNSEYCALHFGSFNKLLKMSFAHLPIIICVNMQHLYSVCKDVLALGFKKILLEKPSAIFRQDVLNLSELCKSAQAEIFVGYNRRYLSSVKAAIERVNSDGGLQSIHFEFSEIPDRLLQFGHPPEVLSRWGLCNSSHILDLFVTLAGYPRSITCNADGYFDWHKAGSRFSGSGITKNGVMFSYISDWNSAGRWGIELYSQNYKLILQPIEKLSVVSKGSAQTSDWKDREDNLDEEFKPGLFAQTIDFLSPNPSDNLCTLAQQVAVTELTYKVLGYED